MRVAVRPQKSVCQAVQKILEKISNKFWLASGLVVVFRAQIFRRATVRWAWLALPDAINGGCNGLLNGDLMSVSKSFKWLVYDRPIWSYKTYEIKQTNRRIARTSWPPDVEVSVQPTHCWEGLKISQRTFWALGMTPMCFGFCSGLTG